jgi:hypothetical protein
LLYGAEGVLDGEACAWFGSTRKFAMGSTYNGSELVPPDNDGVLLQHQEKEGDSK